MTDVFSKPMHSSLTDEQVSLIAGQLSNNETSTDEELFELLIEAGIPVTQARQALYFRDQYQLNIDLDGQPPTHEGPDLTCFRAEIRTFFDELGFRTQVL